METKFDSLDNGLYALIQTTQGNLLVKFFHEEAPVTVANFIGLAEGTLANSIKKIGEPFYNGTIFHRIIKDFMIQGGDPKGNGTGDAGYKFDDEKNSLQHTKKGILSMANSGPNTNGSQFFITEIATPWLDGKHTIFAEVIEGLDVIDALANVATGSQDKPKETQEIIQIEVIRKGEKFASYNGGTFFEENKHKIAENNALFDANQQQKIADKIAKIKEGMTTTESGLMYKKVVETQDKSPEKGQQVSVHYAGLFENGGVFDSSYVRQQPLEFQVGVGQVISGWDEGILLLNKGEKAILWIPSDLAYGKYGAGGVIPPNANLVFEVELIDC